MRMPIKQSENEVKKAIKKYLEFHGWTVYRINNAVPDLYCLKKGEYPLWIETKATGKKPSDPQIEFIQLVNAITLCGTRAFWCDSFDSFLQLFNDIKNGY